MITSKAVAKGFLNFDGVGEKCLFGYRENGFPEKVGARGKLRLRFSFFRYL